MQDPSQTITECGVFPYLLQINGAGRGHRVSVLREYGDVRRAVVLGRVVHRAVLRGVRARRLVRDVGAHGGRPVRAGQPRHHLEVLLITAAVSSSTLHLLDPGGNVRVPRGVPELGAEGEGPLEGLGDAVVEQRAVVLGPEVVSVQHLHTVMMNVTTRAGNEGPLSFYKHQEGDNKEKALVGQRPST